MRVGALVLGPLPLIATLILPPPADLSADAWAAAGLGMMMAIWWLTEAVPLAVTALLPLAVWPILSGAGTAELSGSYAHPLIFLFLGGFFLAAAIERSGLHRRIAHGALRIAGQSQGRVLAAIMGVTAFLSLWISNTASAMVMAPIAAAVAGAGTTDAGDRFPAALMLGVAFAATIGGMGSLIGTPPNAVFAAYMADVYGIRIGFAEWAAVGAPVALCLLVIAWLVLRWFGDSAWTGGDGVGSLPGVTAAERRVGLVAGLTALAWLTRPVAEIWIGTGVPGDAGIAILAAIALFIVPDGAGGRLLDWPGAVTIRWDILLLFGGGLALAQILDQTGLAQWIGAGASALHWMPIAVLIVLIAAVVVYLGELASNTAMAAVFLPIAGATAAALSTDPVLFTVPIALAASVGFMLPVATPPNAIVFTHPAVTRPRMLAAGAPLDLIGIALAAGLGGILAGWVF